MLLTGSVDVFDMNSKERADLRTYFDKAGHVLKPHMPNLTELNEWRSVEKPWATQCEKTLAWASRKRLFTREFRKEWKKSSEDLLSTARSRLRSECLKVESGKTQDDMVEGYKKLYLKAKKG